MEWARRIKAYRRRMGYKQSAAADVLGVSQATLSKWENGLSEPTLAVKAIIQKRISGSDQDLVIARQKFWIENSSDRHVIFKPLSSKLLAISPPSRIAVGLDPMEIEDADVLPRVDRNQAQFFDAAYDILAHSDQDILRISAFAVHYDPRDNSWYRSQYHVMPLFSGGAVYPHLYVPERVAIEEVGELPDYCTIHTVYGEEVYKYR